MPALLQNTASHPDHRFVQNYSRALWWSNGACAASHSYRQRANALWFSPSSVVNADGGFGQWAQPAGRGTGAAEVARLRQWPQGRGVERGRACCVRVPNCTKAIRHSN